MEITGAWLEGDEPEVQQDQNRKAAAELIEDTAPKPEPKAKAKPGEFFNKIVGRMKTVRTLPAELEKCFRDAESLAESGDLTADEMARLTRQFGALRPREVANANG
jgi:hypothetical protein